VTKGANKVVTEVTVMESARFALARNAITLDAIPLGEQPIKIIPAAISGGNPLIFASVYPMKGIMENWQRTPMTTPFGILTTPKKSLTLMEVPIPNMIIWMSGTINALNLNPSYSIKYPGKYSASATDPKIIME